MEILLAVAIMALLALSGSILWVGRAFSSNIAVPEPPEDHSGIVERVVHLEGIAEGLDLRFEALTLAVSDGIARSDRAEKRVQRTVTSARRQIREAGLEHAGIEAEHDELRDSDADPIQDAQVLEVSASVAPRRNTGIPGMSSETLEELING